MRTGIPGDRQTGAANLKLTHKAGRRYPNLGWQGKENFILPTPLVTRFGTIGYASGGRVLP